MKTRFIHIGFILCICVAVLSQNKASHLAFKVMDLNNIWSESTNPMVYHLKDSAALSQIDLGVQQQKGLFKPSYEGENFQEFAFHSEGRKKYGSANLYGELEYNNHGIHNVYGTNVQNTLTIHPYTINDTAGLDFYSGEFFHFEFGLEYEQNEKLHWGFGLNYTTGLSSQDNDPRPKNNTLDLSFKPGAMLNLGRISLGLNFDYQYFNEDIDIITVEENSYHTLFIQHGLGNFSYTRTNQHYRLYKQNTYGSAIQFHYKKEGFSSLSIVDLSSSTLIVQDSNLPSWSQIKSDACLDEVQWKIQQVFNWERGKSLQIVSINYLKNSDLGTEYIQSLVEDDEGIQNWVTFDKSQLYYSNFNRAALEYKWMRESTEGPKGLLETQLIYSTYEEKYLKPEHNINYSYFQPDISYTYIIHLKNRQLSLLANGLYHKNVKASSSLPDNFITRKIIAPDFAHFSADYYGFGFSAACDFIPPQSKISYFIKAQFQRIEQINDTRYRNFIGMNTGILF